MADVGFWVKVGFSSAFFELGFGFFSAVLMKAALPPDAVFFVWKRILDGVLWLYFSS